MVATTIFERKMKTTLIAPRLRTRHQSSVGDAVRGEAFAEGEAEAERHGHGGSA